MEERFGGSTLTRRSEYSFGIFNRPVHYGVADSPVPPPTTRGCGSSRTPGPHRRPHHPAADRPYLDVADRFSVGVVPGPADRRLFTGFRVHGRASALPA